MISLTLKSTLSRALAIFSVITLCGSSFARIELKPAKQPTAEQNTTKTTDTTSDSSNTGYYIIGTVVACVLGYLGVKAFSKSSANAQIDDGDDHGNNQGNDGRSLWFSAQGADNSNLGVNPLFRQLGDYVAQQVQAQQALQGADAGVANADAGNGVVAKKRTGIRKSEIDFLIQTSPNKK